MKIAIYGDSYADYRYTPGNKKTWIHYLEDRLNDQVTSFATSGSGLYFSMKNYLETKKNFDKKIFLVTFPGRLYVPHTNTHLNHVAGISTAEILLRETDHPFEKKIWQAALDYLVHVQNYEEELFKHYCMVDKIKNDDNLLFIPIAKDSLENYVGPTMTELSHIDYNHYHIRTDAPRKDLRCCHMNQQNNKIFADLIYDWLIGKEFVFDIGKFVLPIESENEMFDSTIYI